MGEVQELMLMGVFSINIDITCALITLKIQCWLLKLIVKRSAVISMILLKVFRSDLVVIRTRISRGSFKANY